MNPILALDFGRARIGAAISDELQLLAHPLETIAANEQAPSRVAEIVREKKVDHVVAGLPKRLNGQIGVAATEVLQFVEKLRAILPCQVVTWDERLTTAAAHRVLRDAGKKTRHTRAIVDQVAAQMILQSYLDRRQHAAHGTQARDNSKSSSRGQQR
ncbi:MAG TPA: Holliday junction resolvase RuvX [Candidatus Udaeobacter sp.]|jgi:putative Holliday junction resolvase